MPRYREEQDDLAGTAPSSPSLKTCARDQSVEGLRKRFDIVSKLATPSLFPKHQKSTEAKINKRRGGQTDKEGVSPFRLVDISQHNPSDGRSDPIPILRRRRKTHSSSNVPKMASVILEVNLMYYYTGLGGWRLAGAGTTRPI